jgi:hypothetical protein
LQFLEINPLRIFQYPWRSIMENQLYIRIRGRVLGPYDQEKLQSLARRGQLSRMHELSIDSTNWVNASNFPELFVVEDRPLAAASQQGPSEIPNAPKRQGPSAAPSGRRWWYRKNGSEVGPVEETAIQQILISGNLGPDDIVWTEGMPQWVPARQVPGLLPVQSAPWLQEGWRGPTSGTAEQKDGLPESLCKAAGNSRSWVIFIAVVSFVFAVLAIIDGIFMLIQGANHHLSPVVFAGLIALIYALDVAVGGFLLSSYAGRVANLKYSSHSIVLEKALETLRMFWIYISINLIVSLALILVVLILAFSAVVTIPGM